MNNTNLTQPSLSQPVKNENELDIFEALFGHMFPSCGDSLLLKEDESETDEEYFNVNEERAALEREERHEQWVYQQEENSLEEE